jgi:hypothetical protein
MEGVIEFDLIFILCETGLLETKGKYVCTSPLIIVPMYLCVLIYKQR